MRPIHPRPAKAGRCFVGRWPEQTLMVCPRYPTPASLSSSSRAGSGFESSNRAASATLFPPTEPLEEEAAWRRRKIRSAGPRTAPASPARKEDRADRRRPRPRFPTTMTTRRLATPISTRATPPEPVAGAAPPAAGGDAAPPDGGRGAAPPDRSGRGLSRLSLVGLAISLVAVAGVVWWALRQEP